ncbi:hypothetical protein X739_31195 [Mesorhizobium sp. LNHC220B00]|nr:hypothetical protein X739_31195 [Mesorhizobium sp. LNHC220B00]
MQMRLSVEIAKRRAALNSHGLGFGLNQHATHSGEVDDDAVVA